MHVPKHFGLAALFSGELFTTDAYAVAHHIQYGYFYARTARHRRRF
jgi:hypothetical protein